MFSPARINKDQMCNIVKMIKNLLFKSQKTFSAG